MLREVTRYDKNDAIIFKPPSNSSSETVSIKIEKFPIKQTCYVIFIGVPLDENLSWKYHLKHRFQIFKSTKKGGCKIQEPISLI